VTDSRRRLILAGAVALIFAVSANIAWLNPWPDRDSFRGIDSVPVMWQYNRAAGVEILSAAYFPETFRTYTDRINRPTYPVAVWALGNTIGFVLSPVVDLGPLERAGAGYVVLKLLVFFAGATVMYRVLRRWIAPEPALFAVLLMLFHAHSIEYVGTFQTTELQVITPIFVIAMFLAVVDRLQQPPSPLPREARRRRLGDLGVIALASIALGVLMLAKQNYAVYLAIILFALWKRRWAEVAVSIVAHLIPLGIYLLYLRAIDIPYVNHEAATYDQGVWMVDLFRQNPIQSARMVLDSIKLSLRHLVGYFGVWLLLAAGALARRREFRLERDHLVFAGLLLFGTWAQVFAAARYYDYMLSDVAIVVYGLAAWVVWYWLEQIGDDGLGSFDRDRRSVSPDGLRHGLARGILTVWFLVNVLSFVNFPWVHPFDQPARGSDILENRLEMVENPDAFTDEQRARARGGVIVEPEEDSP
jgi:hypothetical protein